METLEERVIREWKVNQEIKAEFGSVLRYYGYLRAVKDGWMKPQAWVDTLEMRGVDTSSHTYVPVQSVKSSLNMAKPKTKVVQRVIGFKSAHYILNSPWAVIPEKLQEIQSVYMTHLRGEKIDIKAIEAETGQPLNNEWGNYDVVDGIAILPIDGIITKKMNLITKIFGGVSSQTVGDEFQEIMSRSDVKAVILNIDSPGGTVDGTQELARLIASYRGTKPIIAYSDGAMMSAAYWIGAAADSIYISGDNIEVGSIGVVTQHIDVSGFEDQIGIKTTEITAGHYERIASEYAPLTKSGREYIQNIVDHIYSVFVSDVAKFRGVSVAQVLENMADGRIFLGERAIDAGLVDGFSTKENLVKMLSAEDEF